MCWLIIRRLKKELEDWDKFKMGDDSSRRRG